MKCCDGKDSRPAAGEPDILLPKHLCGICDHWHSGRQPIATPNPSTGWRDEAIQLRKNYANYGEMMNDFADMFEELIMDVKVAKQDKKMCIAALALHHLAMSLHVLVGPKTLKLVTCGTADVDELPKSFGNFGRKIS